MPLFKQSISHRCTGQIFLNVDFIRTVYQFDFEILRYHGAIRKANAIARRECRVMTLLFAAVVPFFKTTTALTYDRKTLT